MSAKLYTSLAEAIQELKMRGFSANFEFLDQAFRDIWYLPEIPLES
jgi:hypothetical protein